MHPIISRYIGPDILASKCDIVLGWWRAEYWLLPILSRFFGINMDPYERRSGCTCAERALRHHRLAGANARCERLATSCQPLSPTILGHPSKKRPHQGFSRGKVRRVCGSVLPGPGKVSALLWPSSQTQRTLLGRLWRRPPLCAAAAPSRPLGSKNAFRTDASAETRLVHAMCTPKARRESRRRKAAFSTECRGGSAAHLQRP